MIEFRPDGPSRRIVHARCDAPSCNAVNDGVVQSLPPFGEWPDARAELAKQGWLFSETHDYCSKLCSHKHALAVSRAFEQKPVLKLNDASYARTNQAAVPPEHPEPPRGGRRAPVAPRVR